jgi:signal transduction histidine kinase
VRSSDGDDERSSDPQTAKALDELASSIADQASADVQRAISERWDADRFDLYEGIRAYALRLFVSIQQNSFEPLREFIEGMDVYWRSEEFAISPLINCMFIIEDVAIESLNRLDGGLAGSADQIKTFTREAITLLSARSVDIVTSRLETQVENHREGERRLLSLQRVSASMVSDLDQDRTLQLIADEARRLIGADGVVIRTANDAGDLEFVIGSGDEDLFMRAMVLPFDFSLSGEALRTRTPVSVDDIRYDARVNREYLNVSDSRSLLIVPLVAREKAIGVITGTSTQVSAFSEQDISILSLFADQAASAMENARLFQQAHQQIAELESLHRVARLVSSSLDLEEIFQTLYEEVARLMPADAFLVALARPDGLHDFEFVIDDNQRFPPRRALPLSPILSESLAHGEMFIQRDVTKHPKYPRANRFGNTGRQAVSVLAAPLMRGEQVIGMISAQSYIEHDYRNPEARMLRTIATHAAIAIEHARLYREAQNVAVAEERARLAREIHDTLAQGLIGVILCLERLDLAVPADDACYRPWIERALEQSRSSLDEARRSVRDLRAAPLEGRNLLEAVTNLIADLDDSSTFDIDAQLPASLPPLSARVETALFRVIQEALFNAGKHAQCNEVSISLRTSETVLLVEIEDDGVGFDRDAGTQSPGRFGLTTMHERMLQIGGRLGIESSPGNGTSIVATVPVPVAVHRESEDRPYDDEDASF